MTDLERLELLFRRIQDDENPPRDVGELVDVLVTELSKMNTERTNARETP